MRRVVVVVLLVAGVVLGTAAPASAAAPCRLTYASADAPSLPGAGDDFDWWDPKGGCAGGVPAVAAAAAWGATLAAAAAATVYQAATASMSGAVRGAAMGRAAAQEAAAAAKEAASSASEGAAQAASASAQIAVAPAPTTRLSMTDGGNTAEWVLDAQGRLRSSTSVQREVHAVPKQRTAAEVKAQHEAAARGRTSGDPRGKDEGGHVWSRQHIRNQEDSRMLFPQHPNFNKAAWKRIEGEINHLVEHGYTAYKQAHFFYGPPTGEHPLRPVGVTLSWRVVDSDGKTVWASSRFFWNEAKDFFTSLGGRPGGAEKPFEALRVGKGGVLERVAVPPNYYQPPYKGPRSGFRPPAPGFEWFPQSPPGEALADEQPAGGEPDGEQRRDDQPGAAGQPD